MIVEFVFNLFFGILEGLLSFLPDISWTVTADLFTKFFDVLRVAGYLLPMPTVFAILKLIVVLTVFRAVVALIRTIWDLIPLL